MKRQKLLVMGLALSLAMGLGLVSHAYTQNFSPTNATVQLWLDDHLTLPVPVESQAAVDFYLYELARMTPYQPKGDELLEQGVVLNLSAPDGTGYRYTFYKNGLVACQKGQQTLWYRAEALAASWNSLLNGMIYQWRSPVGYAETLPDFDRHAFPARAWYKGSLDDPVDLDWLAPQIKLV